jgi:phosphoenolpyruvate carboxykinase (GTP)
MAEDPQGVPISAIVFGGRRASLVPLVFEARDWTHGVLVGAGMASETTAAATGAVGVVRRDSMAMKPFCGYNFADYFSHWLSFGAKADKLPKVFHVNWFRKGSDGKFLWPGFGDNLRVLEWMLKRCEGKAGAVETPVGLFPKRDDMNLDGLTLSDEARDVLFGYDRDGWRAEMASVGEYLAEFGPRLPAALEAERQRVAAALEDEAKKAAA